MGSVCDVDFCSSLCDGSGSNATPRPNRLLPAAFKQIRHVIAVHLHVGAVQLRLNHTPRACYAAASLQRSESCGTSTRRHSCESMHLVAS
jgi:hypothetical protein